MVNVFKPAGTLEYQPAMLSVKEPKGRCQRRSSSGCSLLIYNSKLWTGQNGEPEWKNKFHIKIDIKYFSVHLWKYLLDYVARKSITHTWCFWHYWCNVFLVTFSMILCHFIQALCYISQTSLGVLPYNKCVFCHAANIFTTPSETMKQIFMNK